MLIIIRSIVFVLGFALMGCERVVPEPTPPIIPTDSLGEWMTYIIPEGENYCLNNVLQTYDSAQLHFDLTFDSSAIYQTTLPDNQADWNKVMGFSDCNSHHQQNSLRLGWRWNPNAGIELATYKYLDGVRSFRIIDTIQVYDTVSVRLIKIEASDYITWINWSGYQESRGCSGLQTSYLLYPYFGGDEPAPDTVRVHIRWLKP
jgi:hypothetical protein